MDAELKRQGITHALVNWGLVTPEFERERWPALVRTAEAQRRWKVLLRSAEDPAKGMAVYKVGGPSTGGNHP
jgi:hypothetical protein